ncbi:MAG: NhaA family Na+:H+ antiporter [Chlamydiales bacterium]|jgi:NhaA family Na+:H+ antiporter
MTSNAPPQTSPYIALRNLLANTSSELLSGLLLILATVISFTLANSAYTQGYLNFWQTPITLSIGSFTLSQTLQHWINEGLMTLFFFFVGLEIKREIYYGALSSLKKAMLPIIAAVGGMVTPALIFALFNNDTSAAHGWGIPVATDIAFAVGILALFKNRIPPSLLIFLLTLATADDMGAILIIALFYGKNIQMGFLIGAILSCGFLLLVNRLKVYSTFPYIFLGVLQWLLLHKAGINPDIAGVITAFSIPLAGKIQSPHFIESLDELRNDFSFHNEEQDKHFQRSEGQEITLRKIQLTVKHVYSPSQRLINSLRHWALFVIMPIFALANTGIPINLSDLQHLFVDNLAIGIVAGLALGKPIGIFGASYLAVRFGMADLPSDMSWRHVSVAGLLGGIGFTMSLFIAELSFTGASVETCNAAKISILLGSFLSGILASLITLTYLKTLPQKA